MQIIWAIVRAFFYFIVSVIVLSVIGFFTGALVAPYLSVYDATKAGPIYGLLIGFVLGLMVGSFFVSRVR